jgi:cellulose synthase/poly-beta-1,6-N-acetylglucosamine synthase-like glycosyltransferase
VSTGFRWYLPGSGFVSHLRTAWDAQNATFLGDHKYNFAWGGSMAVRTVDFKRLAMAERHWVNVISNDNSLTRAVQEAGGRIRFEPRCLVASRGEMKFGEFLRWTNRHWTITRLYWLRFWWAEAAGYAYYCGTVLLGLVMLALPGISTGQRLLITGILLTTLLLVMSKGLIHMTIAKELFPEEASCLSRYGSRYWQLSLLVPWVVLINILVSSVTRRIEWRGTHYELRGRNETRVIRRET